MIVVSPAVVVRMFIAILFTKAKTWKEPKWPVIGNMVSFF
jgi:hypothetical protein